MLSRHRRARPGSRLLFERYARGLDLRFAQNKVLPAAPTITYSGADNGTYFDSSGVLQTSGSDEARFDHTLAGVSLGLLIEEARINRALRNRDHSNAAWVASNMTQAKDATGLDGVANSATTLTATAANATSLQTVTIASSQFTNSIYVKRKTGTGDIDITDNNGTNWTTLSGLSSLVWTRHNIVRTQANPVFGVRIVTSGDAVEVDFAGLEPGAFLTSPVEVEGSAVTRTADVATMSDVSWHSGGAGTWFAEFDQPALTGAAAYILQIDDGDSTDRENFQVRSGAKPHFEVISSGGNNGLTTAIDVIVAGTTVKIAAAYETNDLAFSMDGASIITDATVDFPTDALTTARIGVDHGNANPLNGHIARIAYWPRRLPNGLLQNLTA